MRHTVKSFTKLYGCSELAARGMLIFLVEQKLAVNHGAPPKLEGQKGKQASEYEVQSGAPEKLSALLLKALS